VNSNPLADLELRFGPYEFHPRRGDLWKSGCFVRLQPQPAKVLALLVSRPGQPVLREEFQQEIWGEHPAVDVDRSLNFCIRQLRATLDDNPDSPQYIETVPRRGYRFVAPVSFVPLKGDAVGPVVPELRLPEVDPHARHLGWFIAAILFVVVVAAIAVRGLRTYPSRSEPAVTEVIRLTNDGNPKVAIGTCCTVLANDGKTVYFSEMVSGRWILARVSAASGEVTRIPTFLQNAGVVDLAKSTLRLLVLNWEQTSPIWVVSAAGGKPDRLGALQAHDATWSPDGRSIVYTRDYDLYTADANGHGEHRIAHLPALPLRPRWSPDGTKIRVTLYDSRTGLDSLWELTPKQQNAYPLFPGDQSERDECCGVWTADKKYFIYQSTRGSVTNLWAIREPDATGSAAEPKPIRLTTGPIDFLGPSPSPDGQRIFAVGLQRRGELMRYESNSKRFVTWLSGLSAEAVAFSRDGLHIVWVSYPDGALWRSRADGTQRTQLVPAGMSASLPRWSPDGTRVLFTGARAGKPVKAYVVSADGGIPEPVLPGNGPEFDAGWSPDGQSLIYSDSVADPTGGIHLMDLRDRRVSKLPGSEDLFSPRWSADGLFIAALTKDSLTLKLLDRRTGQWRILVHGQHVAYPSWSKDLQWIYFCSPLEERTPFYRVRINDSRMEPVTDAAVPRGLAAGINGWWTGIDLDDTPLLLRDASIQEVYALTVSCR
jgi:Tol biopolymer transport system component/DNA-binding winged helix-turn-helix (wHTH) protein